MKDGVAVGIGGIGDGVVAEVERRGGGIDGEGGEVKGDGNGGVRAGEVGGGEVGAGNVGVSKVGGGQVGVGKIDGPDDAGEIGI